MCTKTLYSSVEPDLKKEKKEERFQSIIDDYHYKSDSLSLNCSYPRLSAYQISAGDCSQYNDALHVFIVSNYKITFSVHT